MGKSSKAMHRSAPAMVARFCATLALNGETATEYTKNSKAILDQLPRGAYTTARTFEKYAVFELETHVNRMAQTCRLLAEDDPSLPDDLADPALLSPLVQHSMASAIYGFEKLFGDPADTREFKLTLVATWDGISGEQCSQAATKSSQQQFDIYSHCQSLDYQRKDTVKLEIRGKPRENALAKDSNWTAERKPLEQLMAADCEELILADEAGQLPEGSQTNFYAIDAATGELITAADGILEGTVRRVLLDVCEADGIGVRFESPTVGHAKAGGWAGAAISSTSRLLLPVDIVTLPTEGLTVEACGGEESCLVFSAATAEGPHRGLCEQLAIRVNEEVARNSTALPLRVVRD